MHCGPCRLPNSKWFCCWIRTWLSRLLPQPSVHRSSSKLPVIIKKKPLSQSACFLHQYFISKILINEHPKNFSFFLKCYFEVTWKQFWYYKVSRSAGDWRTKKMNHGNKKDGTIVTNGDIAVSKFLECELGKLFPDYEVFSEESCDVLPQGSKVIVIDPIDGTKSYHRHEDTWCILVGF